MKLFWYIGEIRPISLRLFYVGAALVLFCSQEYCCYIAILSMRALRPHFHATSAFFLNWRINTVYIESVII